MNVGRQCVLELYYQATRYQRARRVRWLAAAGQAPVSILFYHRVADRHPNAWTISTRKFIRHIEWIRRRYEIIALAEAQRRLAGRSTTPAVCITFDDGYADNCDAALPYLLGNDIPLTYFVASEHVLSDLPFPHDIQHGELLRPNTPAQIRALAQAGVEIGAHTRTHANLGAASLPAVEDEIAGSKQDLEQLTGTPVRYFAFPYGQVENMSQQACDVARTIAFAGVCSAYGGYNFPGGDPFHLCRIHGDPEMVRLKNWLTYDPRKAACHRAFALDHADGVSAGFANDSADASPFEALPPDVTTSVTHP